MSDKKYDSEFIGWVDEPMFNDNGELIRWKIKFKDHELKDVLENYVTPRNEKGEGGNAIITLAMSKNGKPYGQIYNPNSEAAKERIAMRETSKATESKDTTVAANDDDGLPF